MSLEMFDVDKVLARIVIIQRWVRAKLLRCRFLHIRRSTVVLQVQEQSYTCTSGYVYTCTLYAHIYTCIAYIHVVCIFILHV